HRHPNSINTMRFIQAFLFLLISLSPTLSQEYLISGTIEDPIEEAGIPMATVALINVRDSTLVTGTTTDIDGRFELSKVKKGQYIIKVQYLGYETTYIPVNANQDISIPSIELHQQA